MRVCLIYDCLFPHTVGGAERWYRSLAERLVADGHEVTYVTRRQWPRGERADIDPRVRVVAVTPRMELYTQDGRRRILPPLVFGAGVLWHLLRKGGRYEAVHTCSFPYFSLLAAAAVRPLHGYELVVRLVRGLVALLLARLPRGGAGEGGRGGAAAVCPCEAARILLL